MRCPFCSADDDRVVDSRLAEDGVAIRRRRECSNCNQRYTTFERIEEIGLYVIKRSGEREPFDRAKILRGLRAASKNRPVDEEVLETLVISIDESLRLLNRDVTSEEVGMAPSRRYATSTTSPTCASPRSTRASKVPRTLRERSACSSRPPHPNFAADARAQPSADVGHGHLRASRRRRRGGRGTARPVGQRRLRGAPRRHL
jgi:transcriptional repressor NrdR